MVSCRQIYSVYNCMWPLALCCTDSLRHPFRNEWWLHPFYKLQLETFYWIWLLHSFSLFHWYFSGPSWSWSSGSWIYNFLCNQYLSPLKLWVRTPSTGRWFSLDTRVSSTNRTDHHDITEILLKVALNTTNQTIGIFKLFIHISDTTYRDLT